MPKKREPIRLAEGLPRDLAASLGRMIARNSLLEIRLAQTLYKLAEVNRKIGRVVIGTPRGSEVLDRMLELAHIQKLDLSPFDWTKFKTTLAGLKSRRDIFSHSPWVYDSSSKKHILVVTRGNWPAKQGKPQISKRIDPEGKEVSAQDLRALRREIDMAIRDAETLDRFVQISLQVRKHALTRKST